MRDKFSILILSTALVLAAGPAFAGDLQIHTIDVGQGASELVIGPNGTTILIDGGEGSEVVSYLNGILSSRYIDYMIASHDDKDHYGGLKALLNNRWSAGTIYHCGENTDFGKGDQIPLGLVIDLGNGAKATCVGRYGQFVNNTCCPTGGNNGSVCLLIEYGVFDYVTAGDLESREDFFSNALINYPPGNPYLDPAYGADVIHVNHHGSDGSSRYYYINRLKPELAVINGGTNYAHPRWTTVDRLKGRPHYTIPCSCDPYRCDDPTYVTWSGADTFRTTTSHQDDCRIAPIADCPALGDMKITYNGVSPFYYLNGTPYAIDEPVKSTRTPTPTPTPSPPPTLIPGKVIINEILAMVPLGTDGNSNGDDERNGWEDEFIELVNWTNQTVNLGGCTISDSSRTRFTFDSSISIPSGKALVLWGGGTAVGDFGGAITLIASTQSYYGLSLTDSGDTVTLRKGDEIYDRVTYGQQTRSSYNRWPEIRGPFTTHNLIDAAEGRLFSPGTKVDGSKFKYEPTPTPDLVPTPPTFPTPEYLVLEGGDYDGDGTDDIAVYQNGIGYWAVKGITRVYFGSSSDLPIPADYDGDGTTDIAVFKAASGLWAIRGITRLYFGRSNDLPVPADYDGDGSAEVGIFRESSGLWAVRRFTRLYFGSFGDIPVPGDYNGDGRAEIAIFRERNGLWAAKFPTWTPRMYFGGPGDRPVAGDYTGNGFWTVAVFRGSSGLWAIRNLTRCYFGNSSDRPVPADYDADGADDIGIFRSGSCLWAVRGVTRTYYGSAGVVPVTR